MIVLAAVPMVRAQRTPSSGAVKMPDSLVFSGNFSILHASLVYHPINQRYHSVRLGQDTFPLHTWTLAGGLSVHESTAGLDTRGMWYNPNTGELERNCYSNIGWSTVGIDGAANASNDFNVLFTGQRQPSVQSVGTYDPITNTVLFYSSGNLHVYGRTTGSLIGLLPLTGVSLSSVNQHSVIYTGEPGHEVGLLDHLNKRVLLFDRATGLFSGAVQLPASAPTHSQFRFCYANGRVWLFDQASRTWTAYCIWDDQCGMTVLPVSLLDFTAHCEMGVAWLEWSTVSEQGSDHFLVEASRDLDQWEPVATLPAAGNSQQLLQYRMELAPQGHRGTVYFRLRAVDRNGALGEHRMVSLAACSGARMLVHPNPVLDILHVRIDEAIDGESVTDLVLYDGVGRSMPISSIGLAQGPVLQLDLSALAPGTYELVLRSEQGRVLDRARVVKL